MMGHGSELATYDHYVHSLELLLFIACTHPGYAGRTGALRDRLASDRAEIRALLGRTVSFRLPGKDLFEAIPKIAKTCSSELTELHRNAPQLGASALVPRTPVASFPSLFVLLQSDKSVSGSTQARRSATQSPHCRRASKWLRPGIGRCSLRSSRVGLRRRWQIRTGRRWMRLRASLG